MRFPNRTKYPRHDLTNQIHTLIKTMNKILLVIIGIIAAMIGLLILAEILKALLGLVLFVSLIVILVGGAFLILRKIFNE